MVRLSDGIENVRLRLNDAVKCRLSVRGRDRSNDEYENRRIIEQALKNFTLCNKDKITYYITYYSICIYR
jgi:hypothetical protein